MPYQMPYPMSGALPPNSSCSIPGHPTCADRPTDDNNINSPKSNSNGTENDKPEDENENKSDSGSKQGQDNGTGMGEGWGNDNNTNQNNNTWNNDENKPNWDQTPAQNSTAPAANNVDWNQTAPAQPQNTAITPAAVQSVSIPANQGDTSGQARSLYGPFGPYYSLEALTSPDLDVGAEEEPKYDVPQHWSNEWRVTKQVQCGRGYFYVHNSTTPVYLDSVREPYARFQFNYRTRGKSTLSTLSMLHWTHIVIDQIKNALDIDLEVEPSGNQEVQQLQGLDKQEIIEMLLRAKSAARWQDSRATATKCTGAWGARGSRTSTGRRAGDEVRVPV